MLTGPANERETVGFDVRQTMPREERLRRFSLVRERLGPESRGVIDRILALKQLEEELPWSDDSDWEEREYSIPFLIQKVKMMSLPADRGG